MYLKVLSKGREIRLLTNDLFKENNVKEFVNLHCLNKCIVEDCSDRESFQTSMIKIRVSQY